VSSERRLLVVSHPGVVPVLRLGRPSRHAYLARVGSVIRRLRPGVAFLEEEYFSIPAAQWGVVAARLGVPFGVQAAENLDKPLSLPARAIRRWTLRYASFVAARSPTRTEEGESNSITIMDHRSRRAATIQLAGPSW
jgi:hypothetical protein